MKPKKSIAPTPLALEFTAQNYGAKKIAERHSFDPRNQRAAECLGKLAILAKDLSNNEFALLKPYCGWASESWREGISQTSRLVGFQHKISDLPSFVKTLVGVLKS